MEIMKIARRFLSLFNLILLFAAGSIFLLHPSLAEPSSSIAFLNHRVIDAEYSKQLDRIVTVSATPRNQLHVVDPLTGASVAVDLPLAPSCVSVGPDGLFAAVGHNGWISYVNLSAPALVKILPVTTDVLDIVLAVNGWVYAFPRIDQWETIRCVNLESGVEVQSSGQYIRAGTLARLHPNGSAIYGADNGLSPSDIEKYDITQGGAVFLYDSPYHGDYAMCGNLWISEDGFRIFTKCGNVFRSSESRSEDMVYNGSLASIGSIVDLSHSASANKVLAIPGNIYGQPANRDTDVWKYDYTFLTFESKIKLPAFSVNGQTYPSHGKFVFFGADGARYSVIVQADPTSGMLLDYGIYTVGPGSEEFSIQATTGPGGTIIPSGEVRVVEGTFVAFTLVADPGYEVADVVVDGVSVGKKMSYAFDNVVANHSIEALFIRSSGSSIAFLNHRVIDAEYSKQLDRIVTVSATPRNQLHVVDPLTGASVAVDLPLAPSCVSVGPDGLFAAVGHDGWISYVNLSTPALVKILPVTAVVWDIVLAGNGWVYALSLYEDMEVWCINLKSGEETIIRGFIIHRARLHPSGKAIYGAHGASPSDIEKYDITQGPAVYLYDSPYHGDYAMCGDLWISEDGFRIFTKCGNVFRSSESRAEDMVYNGSLASIGSIVDLSHSASANKVLAIPDNIYGQPANRDTDVWKYDYTFLTFESKIRLPAFSVSAQMYPSHGKFIFFSADGSRYSVLLQADPSSGMLLDYGIFTLETDIGQFFIHASASPGGTITPSGAVPVYQGNNQRFTIAPSIGYRLTDVVVDSSSVGPVTSYEFTGVTADHIIAAYFEIDTTIQGLGIAVVNAGDRRIEYGSWNSGGTFSGLSPIGGASSEPPAIAVFMDRQYMAVKGSNTNNIFVKYQDDTGVWWPWATLSGSTNKSPALASFNNRLYLVVKDGSSNNLYLRSMDASENWDTSWTQISGGTSEAPALMPFNNRLYLFVKGATTNSIFYRSMDASGTWGSWFVLSGGTTKSIALSAFNNKLYVFVKGTATNNILYRSMDTSGNWNYWSPLPGQTTEAPSVTVLEDRLYIAVKGAASSNAFIRSMDLLGSWDTPWTMVPANTNRTPVLRKFYYSP